MNKKWEQSTEAALILFIFIKGQITEQEKAQLELNGFFSLWKFSFFKINQSLSHYKFQR